MVNLSFEFIFDGSPLITPFFILLCGLGVCLAAYGIIKVMNYQNSRVEEEEEEEKKMPVKPVRKKKVVK